LSHLFVAQKSLLGAPKMPIIPKGTAARSITAVIPCCFSKPNISLAVALKHHNNKLVFYIGEAFERFGKHIPRHV
jgi:hypothetical protein